MTTQYADTAIESFLELERRFVDFTRLIPVAPEHLRVHSPVLASILLDACSLIEATLKTSMDNGRYNAVQNIAAIRAIRNAAAPPFLNIGHLRTVFRPDALYSKPVWFLPRGASSYPWYAWRQPQGNSAWWGAYNNIKHRRFENAHLATLGTTMHAMKLKLHFSHSVGYHSRMQIASGTIVGGKVVVEGLSLPDGTSVTVLARGDEAAVRLPPEQEAELLDALYEADREEGISAEELFARLRRFG